MRSRVRTVVLAGLLGISGLVGSTAAVASATPKAHARTESLATFKKAMNAAFANLHLAKFPGPTTPAVAPKHEKVAIVECDATLGGCVEPALGAAEAARRLGWSVQVLNGQGQSQRFNELIQAAVAGGATAIITDGIDAHLAAAGLADARSHGLPAISLSEGSPSTPKGFNIDISGNTRLAGSELADFVVTQSHGTAHILALADNEYITAENEVKGFLATAHKCAKCVIEPTMNFISADVSTTLAGTLISYLKSHPGINWINSPYDPAVTGAICPAIREAGLAGKVKVVSMLGLSANLAMVKKQDCEVADATWPQTWNGYAGVDQLIRILDKKSTIKPADENMPVVLLDHNHMPPKYNYEGGKVNFRKLYMKLWKP